MEEGADRLQEPECQGLEVRLFFLVTSEQHLLSLTHVTAHLSDEQGHHQTCQAAQGKVQEASDLKKKELQATE